MQCLRATVFGRKVGCHLNRNWDGVAINGHGWLKRVRWIDSLSVQSLNPGPALLTPLLAVVW